MKKKQMLFILVVLITVISGVLFYKVYNYRYVDFKDEYIEEQTKKILKKNKQKVLKTELEGVKTFEIDTTFTHIKSLEDLKKFPNLSNLEILFTVDFNSGEEREDFKNLASKSEKLHQRDQQMLADTLPKLDKLEKIFLGSGVVCYNLDALKNCHQIEELWIPSNFIENINGIQEMNNLRILDLRDNLFKDISPLKDLNNLEALNLSNVTIENLEILLEVPTLKVIVYNKIENEQQENILRQLEEQGVIVVRKEIKNFSALLDKIGIEKVDS